MSTKKVSDIVETADLTPISLKPGFGPLRINRHYSALAKLDTEFILKQFARDGWSSMPDRARWEAGRPFAEVQLELWELPAVVYLGGKEIPRGSDDARIIEEFMQPWSIACALIGISGVSGGGEGAMSLGQEHHGMGIEKIGRAQHLKRVFPKSGVASVQLAVRSEPLTPYCTPGWIALPTRDLGNRKVRLFTLGVPLLAVFFPGGDATLDEFFFWKTLSKEGFRDEIESPFEKVQTGVVFVDPEGPNGFWTDFLAWYARYMETGCPERRTRKRQETDQLKAGLVKVGDPIKSAQAAFAVLEQVAENIYGGSLIDLWESINNRPFWDTVSDLLD